MANLVETEIDPNELTPKDLKIRWAPASAKTVQRQIRRLHLQAYRVVGMRPRFRLADVLAAEEKAKELVNHRLAGIPRDHVVSVKEARRIARGKRGRK